MSKTLCAVCGLPGTRNPTPELGGRMPAGALHPTLFQGKWAHCQCPEPEPELATRVEKAVDMLAEAAVKLECLRDRLVEEDQPLPEEAAQALRKLNAALNLLDPRES